MRILITNDDGYDALGIKLLTKYAKNYGEVLVCAPKVEQSAKSHSICIKKPIEVSEVLSEDGVRTIIVDSTPADCVRYVYYGLEDDFDIVFSGINNGYNCGEDIMYSGTVAGAIEACLHDKKAIAFSSEHGKNLVYDEKTFKLIMDFILENKLLDLCDCLNVNVPENYKGIKFARQGRTFFNTTFDHVDGKIYELGNPNFDLEDDKETDTYLINNGFITISPLTIYKTDNNMYEYLKENIKTE